MSRARQDRLIRELLRSPEPSIRWRTEVEVLGGARDSLRAQRLEAEVRESPRVRALLSRVEAPHRPGASRSVYHYWQGLHWALASLADLGYPPGEESLRPIADRILDVWLRPWYRSDYVAETREDTRQRHGVPRMQGRARRCASQQGNALRFLTRLGLEGPRLKELADLLLRWQWPDGGWNCDLDPSADTSSFMETLTPMRGLAAYGRTHRNPRARNAAERASEVFLERRLFRRRSNGRPISARFLDLHFPLYWHYDVLGGLRGLAEVGRIRDPRAAEALDWLEDRELPGGGWPVDARYYRVSRAYRWGSEFVDWGAPRRGRRNDWVTTDALYVLREAGRRPN